MSAKELHRKYIALVQPDQSDPDDLQGLTLADMMQLIQNIAADPNATYCSTDQLLDFLEREEDPSSFFHSLSLQVRKSYSVSKQHESTYESAAPGAGRGARGTDGPTRVKPSPFAWSEHAITMGRMELQHSRPTARKPSTISYA